MESNNVYDQYCELKSKHPDAVLLFRTGDSYETYEDDAKDAAEILGITLTKNINNKNKQGKFLQTASFSYTKLDLYLPKLIRAGKRVAICDRIDYQFKNEKIKEHETETYK